MSPARGRPRATAGGTRASDARVVWPPHARQTARSEIEQLVRSREQPHGFARDLRDQARLAGERPRTHARRRDLAALATFTIDPQSARDFDDALSAQRIADGATRVWVHIADVCAHVPEGTPLDLEARRRATSVYFPGGVEPMLPPELSNEACSLVPGERRLAVTAELELHQAQVRSARFYRSLICSDARLDYERVDRIFAGHERAHEPWAAALEAAREAASALAAARQRRGALVVGSSEPEFAFDPQGNVREIRMRSQTESHRLIEQLMIAANEAVARLLAQRRVPCLYRVHEQPEPASIERLVGQLASLEVPTPALPKHLSPSQAADLAGQISRLVQREARRRGHGSLALESLVLRSLKQAYYTPRNLGHAGLRSAAYCHFTSPIRRYPDLICHRALLSTLGEPERAPAARGLADLGAWSSQREREAMEIEREADDVARCFALEQRLYQEGWEQTFTGEVVGLISAGAFVAFGGARAQARQDEREGDASAHLFEGLLPVRRLRMLAEQGDAGMGDGARKSRAGREGWWELNELGTVLSAQQPGATLRLGDVLQVRVSHVDAPRGRAELMPAGDASAK